MSPTPRRICFMIMPFGKKKTDAPEGQGLAEIDFDALWDKALKPAIEKLGYDSVRADQDVGSLIINEMLERLYFSDLVCWGASCVPGHRMRSAGRGLVEAALRCRADAYRALSPAFEHRRRLQPIQRGDESRRYGEQREVPSDVFHERNDRAGATTFPPGVDDPARFPGRLTPPSRCPLMRARRHLGSRILDPTVRRRRNAPCTTFC